MFDPKEPKETYEGQGDGYECPTTGIGAGGIGL